MSDSKLKRHRNFTELALQFHAMNNDRSHFVNSNDICTPMGCVKEMVDTIPVSFWKRKKIKVLDSCCGNGNFHAYIEQKTDLSNLYFNEVNDKRIANVTKYFGDHINLTKKDFLSFDESEQYDLIVSNPPYAKFNGPVRVSKNHNLARAFIAKALRMTKKNGYLLFIVPNNWMSLSDRNELPKELSQYQFLHIDISGAKKWFPKVGSSFTWFLLQKKPNKDSFTVSNNYILQSQCKARLNAGVDFIPLYYNDVVKSIFDKVVHVAGEKYQVETTSYLHHYTKRDSISPVKIGKFKHRLIHTPTQTVYSNTPHKYQSGRKVFLSLTNQYKTFIDDCGMTQSVAFIRCDSLHKAKQIKNELDNPVYQFINNLTRYGNFNNIRVLQKLSVFNSFHLNNKENALISRVNGAYYGQK